MQVHNLVDLETQLATLREWKAAGRIRYLGVTHWTQGSLDDLAAIVAREKLNFVQFAYSIAVRDAERRLLPAVRELDEGDVVVATGFSCRQQIAHFTGVQAQSPAVLLEHVFGS